MPTSPVQVYLGLGGNIGCVLATFDRAVQCLNQHPQISVVAQGPLIQTPAMGPPQPDFFNTVIALQTTLSQKALWQMCQWIEQQCGRKPLPIRWSPRPLDLDILWYGEPDSANPAGWIINSPNLTLPHPGLFERAFVLTPLKTLAPELVKALLNGSL